MALAAFTPFPEIKDLREAEINGIPTLFTMYRIAPETRPKGLYVCEIMGGKRTDFLWLVPLALVNFTGTVIIRQPLIRKEQPYVAITRYGIYL